MGKPRVPVDSAAPDPPPEEMDTASVSMKRHRHSSASSEDSCAPAVPSAAPLHKKPATAVASASSSRSASTSAPDSLTRNASATTPTLASPAPASAATSATEGPDDGYTVVQNKRSRQRSNLSASATPTGSGNDTHPLSRNTPLLRPAVSVARQEPPPSEFPAFRVPEQEGFPTSYDAVAALETEFPQLRMRNIIGKDGSTVLLPTTEESFQTLAGLAADPGAWLILVRLDPGIRTTRGIVMGYPTRMPVSLLKRHPQVEEATRCTTTRLREETRQVLVTVRGPLPPHLDLGNWGTFYIRPFVPEPLRCFRCQRYGHHKDHCSRPAACGICSGQHWTETCLVRYKQKLEVTHRCVNCRQEHHAWNLACPVRLRLVELGRERQARWVETQQLKTSTPAPPGTFVWGSQSTTTPSPPLGRDEFPPLSSRDALSAQAPLPPPPPPTAPPPLFGEPSSRASEPPPLAAAVSPAAPLLQSQPVPSPAHQLPPNVFVMTAEVMKDFARELTLNVAKTFQAASGVKIDLAAFEKLADSLATNLVRNMQESQAQMNMPPPPARAPRQSPSPARAPRQSPSPSPAPGRERVSRKPSLSPAPRGLSPRDPRLQACRGPAETQTPCVSASGTVVDCAPTMPPSSKPVKRIQ